MTFLCFTDAETTGVHPARQVWEVAMVWRDLDHPEDGDQERQFYVDVDLSEADPFGIEVGRFYDRHPTGQMISGVDVDADTLSRRRAALEIAEWTHRAHIIGMVPSFDTTILDPLLREHGLQPTWHYQPVDVETIAVGYLRAERRRMTGSTAALDKLLTPPWDSEALSVELGVEPPQGADRHTALADARWARDLWDAIMGRPDG